MAYTTIDQKRTQEAGGGKAAEPPPPAQLTPSGAALPQHPHSTGTMSDWGMPPDTTRPQTWRDWFVRNYNPSPRDVANIYGDAWTYHMAPLATQGAEAAGAPIPSGYGSAAQRAALEQSRRNAGPMSPFVTLGGYLTSPLTYSLVGPAARGVAGAAEGGLARYLPSAIQRYLAPGVEAGATGAITGASQTAGAGGSPADIAKNAGLSGLLGLGLGAGASAIAPKGVSAADVAGKTQAEADAAQEALKNIKYNWKDVGYQVGGNQTPSIADLLEQQKWASSIKPSGDPGGGLQVVKRDIERTLGWPPYQPEAGGPGSAAAPTPPEVSAAQNASVAQKLAANVQTGADRAIAGAAPIGGQPGQGAAAIQAANDAATRAANAAQLQRWQALSGNPKADIRGQALKATEGLDPASPEFNAYNDISTAPTGYEPRWLGKARFAAELAPNVVHDIGKLAGWAGLPGGGTGGQLLGKGVGALLRQMEGEPVSPIPLQQALSGASPALTGYPVRPPGDPMALSNPLLYLYQNRPDQQQWY